MMNKIFQRNMKPNNNNYQGKEFEADNWLLSEFIVKKVIPVVGFHPFPINELLLMAASVAYTKPTHIFEWGTNVGKSARVFYEVCKFLQLDTAIHSVDLPDNEHHVEHPHKHRGKYVKGKNNVFLHQGDGVETSLKIYKGLDTDATVLFYIDGDHSYSSVLRELNLILNAVKKPLILLHDTFYQTPEAGYNIGPFKAIEDITAQYPQIFFKRINTNTGLPGMSFLYTA